MISEGERGSRTRRWSCIVRKIPVLAADARAQRSAISCCVMVSRADEICDTSEVGVALRANARHNRAQIATTAAQGHCLSVQRAAFELAPRHLAAQCLFLHCVFPFSFCVFPQFPQQMAPNARLSELS